MQKTKEEEFLKLFDRWKEEEKEKLVDEMEKVKEMFMKQKQRISLALANVIKVYSPPLDRMRQ